MPISMLFAVFLLWGMTLLGRQRDFISSAKGADPQTLRDARAQAWLDLLPMPVWFSDTKRALVWENTAYKDLKEVSQDDPFTDLKSLTADKDQTKQLVKVLESKEQDKPEWYDVTSQRHDGGVLHFAMDASAAVAAENTQREFVQTMTKTFAHLATGLAIFNRKRELSLFNPALLDLTGLSAEFLSRRPTLYAFLDSLRDNQMIPEPRDYASWRNQIVALETSAQKGTYSEIWTLSGGTTYRVSGRPYPDGAIAFLVEDISAEMSMTERFQSERRLDQSVLDGIDCAMVVFSSTGLCLRSNDRFRDLWPSPENTQMETVQDCVRLWQTGCHPSPAWLDIRDFVLSYEDRVEWDEVISLKNGAVFSCRCVPLSAGATLVTFSESMDARPTISKPHHINADTQAQIA
jgi:PAS domain-containing protein